MSPAKNKKIVFVVNPRAGVGPATALENLIHEHARAHDATADILYTEARGHATELASAAVRDGADIVAAVGGDGSINEVAKGLVGTNAVLGIVPRGSGNGLARHLGIPLNLGDAVSSIFDSRELAMDVFTLNGKLSLNVSGIGFDGYVTNLFGVKSGRGLMGYVSVTAQEFMTFREFSAEIQINGTTFTRSAFIIAIANSSQYGNNAYIAPEASVCDGVLHVNILKKIPLYRMDFLYDFFAGRVGKSPYSDIMEASRMELRTNMVVPYHVDGEPAGESDRFTIAVSPGVLKVLYPGTKRAHV